MATSLVLLVVGPVVPGETGWVVKVLVGVGAVLLVAAVVGPWVPHEKHSHDEPPGTSGHHGAEGTDELNENEDEQEE